jgi:trehalose 6-phosphate phosphatase
MHLPALPPLGRTALLLDLDGTLLDIAPTPEAVIVPPGLLDVLHTLRELLDDALAVVTGRPVETIERLLGDAAFAVAGEHGAAIRYAPGSPLERPPLPAPPDAWILQTERLVAAHPGTLLEVKARGFTVHYRAVPAAELPLRDALVALLQSSTEFELLPGRMMWEVRPRGTDKGQAVIRLMERRPFQYRLPVFIGDDVTDEDGIVAATAMGGVGLRVPDTFGDPAGVRAWLTAIASERNWPDCR